MARPKYQVLIDWDNDGDFTTANEDVTGDVSELNLDRLRDPITDYMNGTVLDLALHNSDHKYSPPKGTITGLLPGRKVWVRMWYPFDDFVGAANTALASHEPELDAEWTWIDQTGRIELDGSGAARVDSSASTNISHLEFNDTDVSIFVRLKRGATGGSTAGLLLRFVDNSNFIYIEADGSNLDLVKKIAGGVTVVKTVVHAWATSATKDLYAEIHGSTFRVYINNVLIIDEEIDESAVNDATKHGLFADTGTSHDWTWENFGGFRSLFFGRVDTIEPRPKQGAQYCYIRAVDDFELARATTLYMASDAAFPQSTNAIFQDVLDYLDVTIGARILDEGEELVPDDGEDFSGVSWGVSALDAIQKLQDEEDGFIWIDGHGFWHLEDKGHRNAHPHVLPLATIKDTDDGSNPYFADLAWEDGREFIENVVDMQIQPGTDAGLSTVWSLKEKVPFNADETRDFLADVSDFDAIDQEVTLVENTDYEANTEADDSGTDISTDLTVSFPDTEKYNGKGTLIRVAWGSTEGFLTKLQLRATVAVNFDDPVHVLLEDATSITDYGHRVGQINARYIREFSLAAAQMASRLDKRKDPRTRLQLTLNGGSKATMRSMIQRRISDSVAVVYSDMGISENFFIDSESWRIVGDQGGRVFTQSVGLTGHGSGPFNTGWQNGNTTSNDYPEIVGGIDWSDTVNCLLEDGSFATAVLANDEQTTRMATIRFLGLDLPVTMTVVGLELRAKGKSSAGSGFWNGVGFAIGGPPVVLGVRQIHPTSGGGLGVNSNNEFRVWGSPTDLWGFTPTRSDVLDNDFGATVTMGVAVGQTMSVDVIQIKVWYTVP